jgi:hypothetical protein
MANGLLNNLIAYWPGNEAAGDLIDAHVNSLDLTDTNTVTSNPGIVYALARQYTNANSEYHTRPGDDVLLSCGDTDFTIAAWVYMDTKTGTRGIARKYEIAANAEWELYYNSGGGGNQFQFRIYNGGVLAGTATSLTPTPVNVATWYFVVGWHDAVANTVNVQINNGTIYSGATTNTPADSTAPFQIGHGPVRMDGRIGPTMFWKSDPGEGGVLTAGQRAVLWDDGRGLEYTRFDDGVIRRRAHRPPLTYSLTLKPSVISDIGSVSPMDLTDLAKNWTRSIRLQGGFWTGTFTVPGGKRAITAFDTWLGAHIEERSGGAVTWEGMVYEMELSTNGFVYRTSLDQMWNRVRVDYDAPSGGLNETDWATNDLSISRFGTKEMVLPVLTTLPEIAERARDVYLSEYGWPWPKVIGVCPETQEELRVTVCGYVFMLNWKYNDGGKCWDDCWVDNTIAPLLDCDSDTPACDVNMAIADLAYDFADEQWYDNAALMDFTDYQTTPPAPADAGDIRLWARCALWVNTDRGQCWGYLGEIDGADTIDSYTDPALQTPGFNTTGTGMGLYIGDRFLITHGTSEWIRRILDDDWAGIIEPGSIHVNRIQVFRYNNNRADIGGERAWEAMQRAVSLSDWNYLPWHVWVGVGRYLHFEPVNTDPVVYVLDNKWRADPAGSELNPWQLRPGVGKILNFRWSPPRIDYWLEDPATFLMEEITVDSTGNLQPSMAEISQAENLLTYLASLPIGGGGAVGGEGPNPPNWDVERNRPNPLGPGGDRHGYWTVQNGTYVWVHDDSINLESWWNPDTGGVEGI